MKKMITTIALLSVLSLTLSLGGCKSAREPDTAAVETEAESVSQAGQESGSETQSVSEDGDSSLDASRETESGGDEAEVQEDTFED